MFKKLFATMAAVALIGGLVFTANADAALRHFKLDVYKATTERGLFDISFATKLTDNVSYAVYQWNNRTTKPITREATYSNTAGTELLSNPWVAESTFDDTGTIDFYADPTYSDDKTVYLLVVDLANGFSWSGPVTYDKDKTIIIDERPGQVHTLMIPGLATGRGAVLTATNTASYTGVYVQAGTRVVDAWVEVHSPCSRTGLKPAGSSLDVYFAGSSIPIIASFDIGVSGLTQDAYRYARNTQNPAVSADSSREIIYRVHGAVGVGASPQTGMSTMDGFILLDLVTR